MFMTLSLFKAAQPNRDLSMLERWRVKSLCLLGAFFLLGSIGEGITGLAWPNELTVAVAFIYVGHLKIMFWYLLHVLKRQLTEIQKVDRQVPCSEEKTQRYRTVWSQWCKLRRYNNMWTFVFVAKVSIRMAFSPLFRGNGTKCLIDSWHPLADIGVLFFEQLFVFGFVFFEFRRPVAASAAGSRHREPKYPRARAPLLVDPRVVDPSLNKSPLQEAKLKSELQQECFVQDLNFQVNQLALRAGKVVPYHAIKATAVRSKSQGSELLTHDKMVRIARRTASQGSHTLVHDKITARRATSVGSHIFIQDKAPARSRATSQDPHASVHNKVPALCTIYHDSQAASPPQSQVSNGAPGVGVVLCYTHTEQKPDGYSEYNSNTLSGLSEFAFRMVRPRDTLLCREGRIDGKGSRASDASSVVRVANLGFDRLRKKLWAADDIRPVSPDTGSYPGVIPKPPAPRFCRTLQLPGRPPQQQDLPQLVAEGSTHSAEVLPVDAMEISRHEEEPATYVVDVGLEENDWNSSASDSAEQQDRHASEVPVNSHEEPPTTRPPARS
eukprot:gb/GEZN01003424.1/.p1 GENE.gb/GEZN01003424.1/~~gb/GEZN01003424.1/.p1  ORF type:complete len:581 (+),score=37.90 gb/GEZN01003424.1/:87-1745(+)